jgi:hypothetical protein
MRYYLKVINNAARIMEYAIHHCHDTVACMDAILTAIERAILE